MEHRVWYPLSVASLQGNLNSTELTAENVLGRWNKDFRCVRAEPAHRPFWRIFSYHGGMCCVKFIDQITHRWSGVTVEGDDLASCWIVPSKAISGSQAPRSGSPGIASGSSMFGPAPLLPAPPRPSLPALLLENRSFGRARHAPIFQNWVRRAYVQVVQATSVQRPATLEGFVQIPDSEAYGRPFACAHKR